MRNEDLIRRKNHLIQDLQIELARSPQHSGMIKKIAIAAAQAEVEIASEYLREYKEEDAIINIVSAVSLLIKATCHPDAKKQLKKILKTVVEE